MNSWTLKSADFMGSLSLIALFISIMGCGAVGPPIPPEDVGIEAKVRKQQKDKAQIEEALTEDKTISADEEGVELPDLYPIGTR